MVSDRSVCPPGPPCPHTSSRLPSPFPLFHACPLPRPARPPSSQLTQHGRLMDADFVIEAKLQDASYWALHFAPQTTFFCHFQKVVRTSRRYQRETTYSTDHLLFRRKR